MKKEKYITEVKTKKGLSFRVAIPVNGKLKRFGTFNSADYDTPRMAMEAAKICRDQAVQDIRNNRLIEHSMTVDEVYEKSKELLVTNVKTQERHDAAYYPAIPEELRNKPIEEVTAADIQKNLNDYAAKHSQGQLNRVVTIWRQLYQTCFLLEMPITDRSRMVMIPKSKIPVKHRQKNCTPEDLETFIQALSEYGPDRKLTEDVIYAIRIMQYLGLRPQEALALCEEDIDLANELIHVTHSIGSDSSSTRKLITTKTPWSVRTLPIPQDLMPVLQEMIRTRHTVPLLTASDGLPYDIDTIGCLMINVSKKSRVKVNLYMLRHNFATEMVKKDIKTTQNMMGHESAVMTLRYVQDATIDQMKALLDPEKMN